MCGCVVVVPVGVPLSFVAEVFVDVFVVGGGLGVGLYDELVFVDYAVVGVEGAVGDGWCGYLVALVGDCCPEHVFECVDALSGDG